MTSSVVPEFIGGGAEKCKGNCASFWLLDFVLVSSTHPVVFEFRVWLCGQLLFSSPSNLWYWNSSGGTSDFITFYYYFSFSPRQLPPVSKMPFFCGCDPGAPFIACLNKTSQLLWGTPNPQQVVNLSWDGVSSPAGLRCSNLKAFSELPVLWSYWQRCCESSLPALAETCPSSSCLLWLWGWQLPTALALGHESSCVVSD